MPTSFQHLGSVEMVRVTHIDARRQPQTECDTIGTPMLLNSSTNVGLILVGRERSTEPLCWFDGTCVDGVLLVMYDQDAESDRRCK